MTAAANPWGWSPATLKPTADKELAMGLNRFVIHSSVHQPLTGPNGADAGSPAPGLALGPFGQWFNRNETWAEQAAPWITDLSRSSYMLQQGRFVADIAYFYGEDSNLTAIFADHSPDVPAGYNFDFVNADILEHKLSVRDGALVTETGMRYRVLVLDPYSQHMSLPVLRRLQSLVHDGATIIGKRPMKTPSLADDQSAFTAIVTDLWGNASGEVTNRTSGKGHVIETGTVEEALKAAAVPADATFSKPEADSQTIFVHRRTADADIYFVDNRNDRAVSIDASFLVSGKSPELWHPDTGTTEQAPFESSAGRTSVPLKLDPYGTIFIVFRRASKVASRPALPTHETELANLSGPWDLHFEESRGEPATVKLDRLASWTENSDPGIRYFSGHATYTSHFNVAGGAKPGSEISIDLGDVANLAEVTLNGKPLGTAWKPPFRVPAGAALKSGDNVLEVRVVNLWVNRLIGDQQPAAGKKYTFTARNPYKANSPLAPSGLLGPVRVLQTERPVNGSPAQ